MSGNPGRRRLLAALPHPQSSARPGPGCSRGLATGRAAVVLVDGPRVTPHSLTSWGYRPYDLSWMTRRNACSTEVPQPTAGRETPLSILCRLCALRPLYGQAYQGEKDSGTSNESWSEQCSRTGRLIDTLAPSEPVWDQLRCPERQLTSVCAGQSGCGAPRRIRSLPSMRGRFTTPCNTSRIHITAQLRDAAEGRDLGAAWGCA
jgi:hypothetical protein